MLRANNTMAEIEDVVKLSQYEKIYNLTQM